MSDPPLTCYSPIDAYRCVRPELPGNRGGRLKACDVVAKRCAGHENEASGSAQLWDPTNVWGDVLDRVDYRNYREYWGACEWPRSASGI